MTSTTTNPGITGQSPERVDAFIDGLNLYQGLMAKGLRDALWVDLPAMVKRLLLPTQTLGTVWYFTAHRTVPPESYARQQEFLRALDAGGETTRIEGHFDRKKAPCVHCGRMTEVPRERATDVNLASTMIHGAATDAFDVALLISGDDDYLLPIDYVQKLGKRIKVARPPARRSSKLAEAADHVTDLNARDFRRAQLPDPVVPAKGSPIWCPFEWLSIEAKAKRLDAGHQAIVANVLATVGHSRRHLMHPLVDDLWRGEQARP